MSITVADTVATLHILASGGCYGSYGEIDHPIPAGDFTLAGTYTQLMGAYPGKIEYAAQYVGTLADDHLALSIQVAAIGQVYGPYSLKSGDVRSWPACMYP